MVIYAICILNKEIPNIKSMQQNCGKLLVALK